MKLKRAYLIEILIWILALIAISLILFSTYFYLFVYKNSYNLYFNDVDGVIKGSPVKFMGVTVGHVRKLKYDPKTDEIYTQVIITKKNVKIPDGSRAKVEFTGIAGSKSIEILPPETQEPCIGIITQDPLRIKDLFESFKMYSRVIVMIDEGLDKFSSGNAELILKKFAKPFDFSSLDSTLEDGISAHKKFNNAVSSFTKNGQDAIEKIDKLEKRMKKSK